MKRSQTTTQADLRDMARAYRDAWGRVPTVKQICRTFNLTRRMARLHIQDLKADGSWPTPVWPERKVVR